MISSAMGTEKAKTQTIITMSAKADDLKVLKFFRDKLGLGTSAAIRYCLRKTAEQEKKKSAPQSQPA